MGFFQVGCWQLKDVILSLDKGEFVCMMSMFRNQIEKGGEYFLESKCYYLYVLFVCLWVYCMFIGCKFKGLEGYIGVLVVYLLMGREGWIFENLDGFVFCIGDLLFGKQNLYEVYIEVVFDFIGCVMVFVLWDEMVYMVVNNESLEILCMFDLVFGDFVLDDVDFYFELLCDEIDSINDVVYMNVNNGVYCCGFVCMQEVYEVVFYVFFLMFDVFDNCLGMKLFFVGDELMEVDW